MVLRHKSFKIKKLKKRRESIEETRNFLHNIFELTDLSSQRKSWKKQHILQVMQKVFWFCATLGVRPIIARYGWQTWNILSKRWKVLNSLYTWPLILHIRSVNCVISAAWILSTVIVPFFKTPLLATLTKARFYPTKNLSVYETNIIILWRFASSGSWCPFLYYFCFNKLAYSFLNDIWVMSERDKSLSALSIQNRGT